MMGADGTVHLRGTALRLPLRGQRRLGCGHVCGFVLLLPVELRHANHTASTNPLILERLLTQNPTIRPMPSGSQIDPFVERVERLLVRYEELQRTNALLTEQVELLTHERDSLKSRLSAARARVDSLLERLPDLNTPA